MYRKPPLHTITAATKAPEALRVLIFGLCAYTHDYLSAYIQDAIIVMWICVLVVCSFFRFEFVLQVAYDTHERLHGQAKSPYGKNEVGMRNSRRLS